MFLSLYIVVDWVVYLSYSVNAIKVNNLWLQFNFFLLGLVKIKYL